jgi:hypothetical protein
VRTHVIAKCVQLEIVVIRRLHAAMLVSCNAGDERAKAAAKEVLDALVAEIR